MNASRTRRLRWLAPVVAVGAVGAGIAVPSLAGAADSVDDLAPRSAEQLLAAVSRADVDGLSGTVVSTSRLGLPELPTGGGSGGSGGSAVSLPGLLAGSTTARVWTSGEDRSRIAVDGPFAEYDVVRDGQDVWTFDSASSDVTHLVLPEERAAQEPREPLPTPQGALTPEQAAQALLASVDETTEVSVGRSAMVADRPAYELVLEPRDAGTLVDQVRIAVDGETSVPLRVQVLGTDQVEPAIEIGFTAVRFAQPDASVFAFVPPPGSTVTERELPEKGERKDAPAPTAPRTGTAPTVVGEGWSSVVELSGVTVPEASAGLVDQLATPVAGGRVVTSALLSVLLLDDGRVLVGAVPAERLVALSQQ